MNTDIQIVLVEDNEDDAALTMRAMKDVNLINEITWLKDGEKAVDYLLAQGNYSQRDQSKKPKLILLDLKLPKLNGTEVLQIIKENEELSQIPIVVMTSSKEDKDLQKCYELGVNSYVVKPINFSQFLKVTKEISMYWILTNQTPKK
ncbi:MAG: response regulator [Bacteroidota bacterium]